MTTLNLRSCWPWTCFNQSGLSLCRMDLKFSAHTYFMMRNSNLNSVSTENQHEILNKFGKCLLTIDNKIENVNIPRVNYKNKVIVEID